MAKVISNHNNKVLNNTQTTQNPQENLCNCRKKEDCQLKGKCPTVSVILSLLSNNVRKKRPSLIQKGR